jgi:hypothetical protein
MERMTRPTTATALRELADQKRWHSHPERTQAVARSIYLRLPNDYKLWHLGRRFSSADHERLTHALASKGSVPT